MTEDGNEGTGRQDEGDGVLMPFYIRDESRGYYRLTLNQLGLNFSAIVSDSELKGLIDLLRERGF